ncbi:MAG TPA: thiol reductant ABC exporter subunit CydC [Kiloniellaceae bacterium]|nr:thiol reductant ABC exporter subunit CydC [Kiloniellaceae bacterium]
MVLRGWFEQWRAMVAHETAARVQKRLRRALFEKLCDLGPAYAGVQRSGDVTLTMIDGVEQLETYFGKYLPQLLVSLLTPLLIFVFVAFLDLPVAAVLLTFALIALFAPAAWQKRDWRNAKDRQGAYGDFAAELLDSIQGLATLKAFGRSRERAAVLAEKADYLFRTTMWVLGTNTLSRGITDTAIAVGAAAALALGAYRVEAGAMDLAALLMILMMGVEIFRPMRDLRTVLHEGMVGLSAAQGLYRLFDATPPVADAPPRAVATLAPGIAFEGVTFAYPGSRRLVHRGLSFTVKPGERVGVVGPSGVGKSTIVRLLLRFFDPDEGSVRIGGEDLRGLPFDAIRSRIAVVQQDAFLFHGTVGENIRLGRPDADKDAVVAAARVANIHDFIMALPQGYDTPISEKGIKLSGGQRQRVAIARAVLRDAPILILDEALSAVDSENEAVIQEALDRLMQGRTTLVLAHRLSSVIGCDRILVVDRGRVVEEGGHDTLMAGGGIYAALMAEQVRDAGQAADDRALDETPSQTLHGQAASAESPSAPQMAPQPLAASAAPTEGIVAAEGLGWARLVRILFAMITPWKGKMTATFVFGVLRVLAFIGVGVISALIVLALKEGRDFTALLPWLFIAAPLAGILHWAESWLAHDVAFRLLAEMRMALFDKLDKLAPAYLVRRRTGDLMGIATQDVELVEYFFAHTVAPAFVAVLVPALVLGTLAWADPWLAAALLPFMLAVALSPWLLRRRVDRLGSQAREAAGELAAHAVDSVQGLGEVVANRQEDNRAEALDRLTDRHVALRMPFFRELTAQNSLLEVLTGLGGLAVVTVGALQVSAGALDAGLLPLLTLLALAAFLPVSEIAQIGRQLADTLGATRRIYAVEREKPVVDDGPGVPQPANRSAGVTLSVESVAFRYPGAAVPALAEVSFDARPGETVALVGPSGAGKTTTAQLLMRFWDPDAGTIRLDGHDLGHYRLDQLRERVALVAQDTYLFNDSLEANIRIARPDASAEDLMAAIEHAALGELIESLPQGLATPVGERGASLSGGQRQRVAIARAFLKDAPLLILDEATSHLDAVNEKLVRGALDRLQQGRTTVVIAHRLSTVRRADRIVAMEAGRVVEAGRHEDLMARGGLYARLVRRQQGNAGARMPPASAAS